MLDIKVVTSNFPENVPKLKQFCIRSFNSIDVFMIAQLVPAPIDLVGVYLSTKAGDASGPGIIQ